MKKVIIIAITLLVMIGIPFYIHTHLPAGSSSQHYYLSDEYRSSKELFGVLFDAIKKDVSKIFLWCCDCILYYAKSNNLSYEELNIYLFVIWQPYLILLFLTLYLMEKIKALKIRKLK